MTKLLNMSVMEKYDMKYNSNFERRLELLKSTSDTYFIGVREPGDVNNEEEEDGVADSALSWTSPSPG